MAAHLIKIAIEFSIALASMLALASVWLTLLVRWREAEATQREMCALLGLGLICAASLYREFYCMVESAHAFAAQGSLLSEEVELALVKAPAKSAFIVGLCLLSRPLTERLFGNNWLRDTIIILSFVMIISLLVLVITINNETATV